MDLIRKIDTLESLYEIMDHSADVRRELVIALLRKRDVDSFAPLIRNIYLSLINSDREENLFRFGLPDGESVLTDLKYETEELKRDLLLVEKGSESLKKEMATDASDYDSLFRFIRRFRPEYFITDRDGTISNYCSLYGTSHQSAYSAWILSKFAEKMKNPPIVLTSGPTDGPGIVDLSVMPPGMFIYAASKGREIITHEGKRISTPLDQMQSDRLNALSNVFENLLRNPPLNRYRLIGSGFQKKYGQLTIARQDKNGSIPVAESIEFLNLIKKTVTSFDAQGSIFRVEDTGKDVEIHLTVSGKTGSIREFDKGDGIGFAMKEGGYPRHGRVLIAGDTVSDLPMVRGAREFGMETALILVRPDARLREKASKLDCPVVFCNSVESLLLALNKDT